MNLSIDKTASGREYKVRNISQAAFGHSAMAVWEMFRPISGLRALRSKYGRNKPLNGAKITASIQVNTHAASFIETLTALGAEVRCCSSDISSTFDTSAAAIARDYASIFAWNGQTQEEYWWCTEQALNWGPGDGPNLIVDESGDITLLIREGIKAEKIYEETGELPDPSSIDDAKIQAMVTRIRDGLEADPKRYHKIKEGLVGVSEMATTGVQRLCKMLADGTLVESININDSPIKPKFNDWYGSRLSLPEGLMRSTGVPIANKIALVCGYGDVGKACTDTLKEARANVFVTENNPEHTLEALMEGITVKTLDDMVTIADIFINTTDNKDSITVDHMRKMKNNAIICSIGQLDNDIDMQGLEMYPNVRKMTINPQTERWVFPETNTGVMVLAEGRMMNLGCATGHLSFVESCPYTDQVIGLIELWKLKDGRIDV